MTNSFGAKATLETASGPVTIYRLAALAEAGLCELARLPYSIRVLLECVLRQENGREVTADDVRRLAAYDPARPGEIEVPFQPARVLLQDFTGVPAVVDLAAMRSAVARLGGDPARINPLIPVDLVIDHSVQTDAWGCPEALARNVELEFRRNRERYEFLRWGQKAFRNFRVVPPASGICHQVDLEYLSTVVASRSEGGETVVFPDSVVGTDSHTPTVNGLGVIGWGVGGIEAEANMLGQPMYMLAPAVVGVRVTGRLADGVTATDAVLTVTQVLRRKGVVGKFVEFFGPGLAALPVPDRATLANMAPEYGATMGFFPVDEQTLAYLRLTGRPAELVDRVERYCRAQALFRADDAPVPQFESVVELDLGAIVPCVAGPSRPQDRVPLRELKSAWRATLRAPVAKRGFEVAEAATGATAKVAFADGRTATLTHGSVIIASVTSCTNTSNPAVMVGAGLLARKAVEAGLSVKPWVKTSLAPGSKVVTDYLGRAGLTPYLEALGFHNVGYGCLTCIGNSGPTPAAVAKAIEEGRLVAAAVLSGNRNFEGRISPDAKAGYLASPLLVVAFALAGTVDIDLEHEPLGQDKAGRPVFLRDLWPSRAEIAAAVQQAHQGGDYVREYAGVEEANATWNAIPVTGGALFPWQADSTYIQEPPFFGNMTAAPPAIAPLRGARALAAFGDSITTDHISPAGSFSAKTPAGQYLQGLGVRPEDFNSYGSRRGNDRVMARGTFANIRLKNAIAQGREGGWTTHWPTGELVTIYEASCRYRRAGTPLVILAGVDYGMGSSRDWAAKGPCLLGVRAVLAQSFERIHRSNLVGMGILPLQFRPGETAESLGLTGAEAFDVLVDDGLRPRQEVAVEVTAADGARRRVSLQCRLDTPVEVEYYRNGGILQAVLRKSA